MLLKEDISIDQSGSFKVFSRIRPFKQNQLKLSCPKQFFSHDSTDIYLKTKHFDQSFSFDNVFDSETSQQQVFNHVAKDIVQNAFQGINGSIFCYGQTSSGKTHTIVGDFMSQALQDEGLLPRIIKQIVCRKNQLIDDVKSSMLDIRIKVSMIEIYNEKIFDLLDLSKKDLRLRQNKKQGVFVERVTQKYVVSTAQAMQCVMVGLSNRTSGKTNENTSSSRSHMVFTITIVETDFSKRQAKSAKITLTDLAGSQRLSKTGIQGKMVLQTKKINLSLSTLGKVINSLSEGKKKHIPYRDSKLTRLLKESIGGNCITRLIINLSPSSLSEYETISSLRFGSRAKLIKNKPTINKDYTVEELMTLLEKAQTKIKQLNKYIQELQTNQVNKNILPIGLQDLREKVQEKMSFHLIHYNDDQSDQKASQQTSSKISQTYGKQNSSLYQQRSIDTDFESPVAALKKRNSAFTSCKSQQYMSTGLQQMSTINFEKKYHKKSSKAPRTSDFSSLMQENADTSNQNQKNQPTSDSFVFATKNAQNLQLNEDTDLSLKCIRESVKEIKIRCLKKLDHQIQRKNYSSKQIEHQKVLAYNQINLQKHQNFTLKQIFSFSLVGDKDDQIKNLLPFCYLSGESMVDDIKLQKSRLIFSEAQNDNQFVNDQRQKLMKINPEKVLEQKMDEIKQKYELNLQQLQTYKFLVRQQRKVTQQQEKFIREMKKIEKTKRTKLSQDINKLQKIFQLKTAPKIMESSNQQ